MSRPRRLPGTAADLDGGTGTGRRGRITEHCLQELGAPRQHLGIPERLATDPASGGPGQ